MSINVEMIGQTLMIQHYVAETRTPISLSEFAKFGIPSTVALFAIFAEFFGSLRLLCLRPHHRNDRWGLRVEIRYGICATMRN